MIGLSIFTTTEFYVTIFVISAAIVAFSAMPRRRGAVRELLLGGTLKAADASAPSVALKVTAGGEVLLLRRGLQGVDAGADSVSLAVEVSDGDIRITERIHAGAFPDDDDYASAQFNLGYFAPLRYHVRYDSPDTQLSAVFSLTVRPGIVVDRNLAK